MSVEEFDLMSAGSAEWRFSSDALNRLVRLAGEHGEDMFAMDADEVRGHIFRDETVASIDVEDNPYLGLTAAETRFCDEFVSKTPIGGRVSSVDELFEDEDSFEAVVDDQLGKSDPARMKAAIEWRASQQ